MTCLSLTNDSPRPILRSASFIYVAGGATLIDTSTGKAVVRRLFNRVNHWKFVDAFHAARLHGYALTRDKERDGRFPPRIDKWTRVDLRFDPEKSMSIPPVYQYTEHDSVYVHDYGTLLLHIQCRVTQGRRVKWGVFDTHRKWVDVTTEDSRHAGALLKLFVEQHRIRIFLSGGDR